MTDLPVYFRPDPALTTAARRALPDAPLAMPAQRLESGAAFWLDLLTLPLRLLRLPLSRGV